MSEPGRGSARCIALIAMDPVCPNLTGTAIRCLELARVLALAGLPAEVYSPRIETGAEAYPFTVRQFDPGDARRTLLPRLSTAGAVILPMHAVAQMPALDRLSAPLIFDLYDPALFELLASGAARPLDERRREARAHSTVVNHVLRRGDFFLCASERQRDLWLGSLAANGRIVPELDGDESF